ncbi:STAS-like domain-containing protein [Alcanivorax sp. NBRC 102028]|uniref:STAS-like domain-containing protein n=1 Tax=Alcanivorax sp. NBRC 102028 TaxID=1113897 RepID=UPI000789FE7B|nr:STAS-like domain-containing protein [Alcanivorax sp. NBRC 102028]
MNEIKVSSITGANAISIQGGSKLYAVLIKEFPKQEKIILDFRDVEVFASPYFNASIGLLFKDYELNDILSKIAINNLSPIGKQLLNHVIANALTFYKE